MTSIRHVSNGSIACPKSATTKTSTTTSLSSSCHRKSFGLTFSRGWLVQIANETVRIGQVGYYHNRKGDKVDVEKALRSSVENSVHYHSSHTFHPEKTLPPIAPFLENSEQPQQETPQFYVCYGSSLQVARRLKQQLVTKQQQQQLQNDDGIHIGVMNSASGKRPEKFLRGTLSQEEGILRASLLYPCLIQYYNRPHHFYYVNHKPKYQDSPSSCAIWSPKVPVLRHDDCSIYGADSGCGDLLDQYETYSFVSVPAPNAFALGRNGKQDDADTTTTTEAPVAVVPKAQKPGSSDREPYETMTLQEAMHDRIFRALCMFAEHGCTDLVLPAFGCGVHGNDPYQIAMCFHDILSTTLKGRFRTVAFSIHPSRRHNYEEFVKVFGNTGDVDGDLGGSEQCQ